MRARDGERMNRRVIVAVGAVCFAAGVVARSEMYRRAARRYRPSPRLAASLRAALGGQRAPLSRMTDAIGDILQPGETVTYLSASSRDKKGRLAVYAVGATDELAHLTWRGEVPDDASKLDGALCQDSLVKRDTGMVAVPVAVGLAVAEHLVQRDPQFAGDGLEAHAALLVGLLDLTPELGAGAGAQEPGVGFRLPVRLSRFKNFGHFSGHPFMMPVHVVTA